MDQKIKFYSIGDLSLGINYQNAKNLLDSINFNSPLSSFDEAAKLLNVIIIFSELREHFSHPGPNDKTASDLDPDFDRYLPLAMRCAGPIGRFMNTLSADALPGLYAAMDREYQDDFWKLFDKFGHRELLSGAFKPILDAEPYFCAALRDILECPKIVKDYDSLLADIMTTHPQTIELIIEQLYTTPSPHQREMHFPAALTHDKRKLMAEQYVDLPGARGDTLRLLTIARDADGFTIEPLTKLKAKRRLQAMQEQLMQSKKAETFVTSCEVQFSKVPMPFPVDVKMEDLKTTFTFDGPFIAGLDNAARLSAIPRLVGWLDGQDRITLVSSPEGNTIADLLSNCKGPNIYPVNAGFRFTEMCSIAILECFDSFFAQEDLPSVDSICIDFYDNYLRDTFGYRGLPLNLSGENERWVTRCGTISATIESVMKQYNMFVDRGEVDGELLALQKPIKIKDIKSRHGRLFTPEEQDYLCYYLNQESCTNGLNLRNSYQHGTPPTAADPQQTELLHHQNYRHLQRLLILIMAKIAADLSRH